MATSHSGVSLAAAHSYVIGPWMSGLSEAPPDFDVQATGSPTPIRVSPMTTEPLFSIPRSSNPETVTITFDGNAVTVPADVSVAAALLVGGVQDFRSSVVGQAPRAPSDDGCLLRMPGGNPRYSGADKLPLFLYGMHVRRQIGAAHLDDVGFGEEP